jgi:hypothetical protein
MVINDLDIDRAGRAAGPLKTDPPLVVDADAVLTLPIALERFQPIARQSDEIFISSPPRPVVLGVTRPDVRTRKIP